MSVAPRSAAGAAPLAVPLLSPALGRHERYPLGGRTGADSIWTHERDHRSAARETGQKRGHASQNWVTRVKHLVTVTWIKTMSHEQSTKERSKCVQVKVKELVTQVRSPNSHG